MKILPKSLIISLLFLVSHTVYANEQKTTVKLRTLAPHIAHQIVFSAVEDCSKQGYKVSAAVVDRNGKVISAIPGVKGTTNNNPCLLEPAKKTAFMHKWNLDSNAPSQQVGFVVVNFKLGE